MNEIMEKITYPELFDILAGRYGQKTAIKENETAVSYSELMNRAELMGNYFASEGISDGEKVMIQLENSILFAETMFALMKIGAVPVLIYPACRRNEVYSIAETSGATSYVSFRNFKGYDHTGIAKGIPTVKKVFFSDELEAVSFEKYASYSAEKYVPAHDETAVLILSGGSTGVPKLIARKHSEHIMAAQLCAESCNISENSVFLLSMPVSHNFNLVGPGLLGTLCKGGEVVMCRNTVPSEIVSLIRKERVTATALIPAIASECIDYARKNDMLSAFDSLETLQLGGAVCPEETVYQVYNEMKCTPQQIYGMGEGVIFATLPDDSIDVIVKYQGKNLSRFDSVKIVDTDGNEVSEGEYGELIAKGPCIITEYYNSPEANKNKFTADGYYKTGDLVKLEHGGYLHVAGRIDDMINRGGDKIYPPEIEALVKKCKGVRECVVVGAADRLMGQAVCAFVVAEDAGTTAVSVRKELASAGTAAYKIPDEILFIDEIPLTSVKKADKNKLRKQAEELRSRGLHGETASVDISGMDEVEAAAAREWAALLNTAEIDRDSNFIELGGNSIQISQMLNDLNERFSVDISIEEFYSAPDLGSLSDIIKSKI